MTRAATDLLPDVHARAHRLVRRPHAAVVHHHDPAAGERRGEGDRAGERGAHRLAGVPGQVDASVAGAPLRCRRVEPRDDRRAAGRSGQTPSRAGAGCGRAWAGGISESRRAARRTQASARRRAGACRRAVHGRGCGPTLAARRCAPVDVWTGRGARCATTPSLGAAGRFDNPTGARIDCPQQPAWVDFARSFPCRLARFLAGRSPRGRGLSVPQLQAGRAPHGRQGRTPSDTGAPCNELKTGSCASACTDTTGKKQMAVVTMRQLLESGVHFGHQTRRWNPKMKRFIMTERNGIYIIDLQQSLSYIDTSYAFIKDTVAKGGTIMFVGTKKQAQEAIAEQATRVGMPYVNQRWLGGMLTNFQTVHQRINRLKELDDIDFDDVAGSSRTKKELLHMRREQIKLDKTLGGIRDMSRTPSAVWIVDTNKEHLAVEEARKLQDPDHRDPGLQLRPRPGRLPDPGQRRRHPRRRPADPRDRRRRRRRPDRPLGRQGRRRGCQGHRLRRAAGRLGARPAPGPEAEKVERPLSPRPVATPATEDTPAAEATGAAAEGAEAKEPPRRPRPRRHQPRPPRPPRPRRPPRSPPSRGPP